MLELLRPHLERRARAVDTAAAAIDSLAAAEEAGDEARDVVLTTARGTIQFASPRSRALLLRYFGITNGTVPASLLHGTVVGRAPGGRLTVRTAAVDGLVVLLLGEDDDRADLLTPRQREILGAVTEGLTDLQIAERLGIAAATVNNTWSRSTSGSTSTPGTATRPAPCAADVSAGESGRPVPTERYFRLSPRSVCMAVKMPLRRTCCDPLRVDLSARE